MLKIQFDVNIANGVAIDVPIDVLLVWLMEVYLFRINQSKYLLHAEIKWLKDLQSHDVDAIVNIEKLQKYVLGHGQSDLSK